LAFVRANPWEILLRDGGDVIGQDLQIFTEEVQQEPPAEGRRHERVLQLLRLAHVVSPHDLSIHCLMLAGFLGEQSRLHETVCTEEAAMLILDWLRKVLLLAAEWLEIGPSRSGVAEDDEDGMALTPAQVRPFLAYNSMNQTLCPPLQVFLAKRLGVLRRWRYDNPLLLPVPAKVSQASGNMLREFLHTPVNQPMLFLGGEETKNGFELSRGALLQLTAVTENRQLIPVIKKCFVDHGDLTQMYNWTVLDKDSEAPTCFRSLKGLFMSSEDVFQEGIPDDVSSLNCRTTQRLSSLLWRAQSRALFTFQCACFRLKRSLTFLNPLLWSFLVDVEQERALKHAGLPVVLITKGMISRHFNYQGGGSQTFPFFEPRITVISELSRESLADLCNDIIGIPKTERIKALTHLLGTGCGNEDILAKVDLLKSIEI